MKKTVLDAEALSAIRERIGKIKPDSQRLWGKMNAAECLCHMADQIRMTLGHLPVKDQSTFMSRSLVKMLVMAGMPAPKGKVETAPEINTQLQGTKPTEFEADRRALLGFIEEFLKTSETFRYQVHPFFGTLSRKQWGKLIYTHLDHHLSQFGC